MHHAHALLGGLVESVPAEGGLDLVVGIAAVQFQGQGVRLMAGAQGNIQLVGGHLAQVGQDAGVSGKPPEGLLARGQARRSPLVSHSRHLRETPPPMKKTEPDTPLSGSSGML